jgi:hypothetical protein
VTDGSWRPDGAYPGDVSPWAAPGSPPIPSYQSPPGSPPAFPPEHYRQPFPAGPAYRPQPTYGPMNPYPGSPYVPVPTSSGYGVTAMVTGILGVLLFWFPGVGVILAVLGIIFGAIGVQPGRLGSAGRGMAIAGLVLGIVGTLLFLLLFCTVWI